MILGHESFRVRARRGRPLVVVLRSNPSVETKILTARGGRVRLLDVPTARLTVLAESLEVARLELTNAPGWNEHVFEIPGDALGEETTELQLLGEYVSFRYWFFQPR